MIQVVDKANGYVIQRVIHDKTGKFVRYQVVPHNKIGDASAVSCYASLEAARFHVETDFKGTGS